MVPYPMESLPHDHAIVGPVALSSDGVVMSGKGNATTEDSDISQMFNAFDWTTWVVVGIFVYAFVMLVSFIQTMRKPKKTYGDILYSYAWRAFQVIMDQTDDIIKG